MGTRLRVVLTTWLAVVSVATAAVPGKPETLQWLDLLSDAERALGPPPPLPANHNFLDEAPGQAQAQQLSFTPNPALEGRLMRLPGYIVPISQDAQGRVTEFFLVPYFGACIHLPPPPPNQVVYAVAAQPFALKSLTTPYWVAGVLQLGSKTTRLGAAAYTVRSGSVEPYRN